MSWLFSRALVEEYSAGICSDGELSALSSGSPTQQAYCSPDRTTAFSRLSRFGMTFRPLTEDLGRALLMSYQAGFHVRTSAPQVKARELTENDQECGRTWLASWTKYDRVTSSWKTHQCSLLGGLAEFSETWPSWGLMRGGECWEQRTLAPLTSEIASGLWPTPVKSDHQARRPSKNWKGMSDLPSVVWRRNGGEQNPQKPPAKLNARWVEWLMGWPIGWTSLRPLEMDRFQLWRQQHGALLEGL